MRVAGDGNIGDRAGQSVRGPEIVRFDGFGEDWLAFIWGPGNPGGGRRASSRFRPSTPELAPAPSGITDRDGDVEPERDDNDQTARAELESGKRVRRAPSVG